MNPTESFQRNLRFRHVPAGHAGHSVIHDTSPEQPIAAWTAESWRACHPTSTWEFVGAELLEGGRRCG